MVHNSYALFFCSKQNEYQFGFWYKNTLFYVMKTILIMSRELTEFSTLIDEQFEIIIVQKINFWDYLLSLFN